MAIQKRQVCTGEDSPANVAEHRLQASPYHPVRLLKCRFCDGVLTITGRVPSFYLKQLAQNTVASLQEVERVDNRVEVA